MILPSILVINLVNKSLIAFTEISNYFRDTNRVILRISLILLNFSLFKLIKLDDGLQFHNGLGRNLVIFMICSLMKYRRKSITFYKVSPHVIILLFLLLPILKTLTQEICTDTIYFWYFICHFVFVMDSVTFSLNSEIIKKKDFLADEVLPLEESINMFRKNRRGMIFGYITVMIGMILLISRLKSLFSIFIFLITSILCFIALPRIQEEYKMHESFLKTTLFVLFVLRLAYMTDTAIFIKFTLFIGYLIITSILIKFIYLL